MDDWQVGDLALCVALTIRNLAPSRILRIGRVYTVTGVRWSTREQCVALSLAEAKSRGLFGDWHAAVFRKINPLTEEERRSFLADLRQPVVV